MQLWGAWGYLWLITPSELAQHLTGRLHTVFAVAVLTVVAATLTYLPIEAAYLNDDWSSAVSFAALSDALSFGGFATSWLVAVAGVVGVVVSQGFEFPARSRGITLAAGLNLSALSLTGHAVMTDGWLGIVHRLNDVLHVLAAGAWFGALLPVVLTMRLLSDDRLRSAARSALIQFSFLGHIAVAIVVTSGIVNMLLIVGWTADWTSPYRQLLLVKIALVFVMTGMALTNRYLLVPRIDPRDSKSMYRLVRVTGLEIALGIAVMLLVAKFGTLDPG